MAGNLQPLDEKFPIVGADGRPTLYFIKWAQQRQIDITDGITLQDLIDYLTAHQLQEGSGIQITPSGNLNDSPTIAADVQEILDQITSTRGSIIYRGLLGWAALLPGAAGQVLQTNGAGADPSWVTISTAGIEAYSFKNDVSTVVNPTPVPITAVGTLNIPASAVAKTFSVSGMITWRTGAHGMRGSIMLDGVAIFPGFNGSDPVTTGDGNDYLVFGGVVVNVPGDSLAHTISIAWSSQAATTAITRENVHVVAIRIA